MAPPDRAAQCIRVGDSNNNDSLLKCVTYNVRGLKTHLDNAAFIKFLHNYDVVCLTETHLISNYNVSFFTDFDTFCAPAHKLTQYGRAAGGDLVMVKKSISNFVECINTSFDNVVILKFSN